MSASDEFLMPADLSADELEDAERKNRDRGFPASDGCKGHMELVIRIALVFLFIQFLVVLSIMSLGLLLARQVGPTQSRASERVVTKRGCEFVASLPTRIGRSVLRLAHFRH